MNKIRITSMIIVLLMLVACMPVVASAVTVSKPGTVKISYIKQNSADSRSSVSLKWYKASKATGYQIYRATSKYGTYSKIKTIRSGNTTFYRNTGMSTGKTYWYKIRAYRSVKQGKKTITKYGNFCSRTSVKVDYVNAAPSTTMPEVLNDDGTIIFKVKNLAYFNSMYIQTRGSQIISDITDTTSNQDVISYFKITSYKYEGEVYDASSYDAIIVRPRATVEFYAKIDTESNDIAVSDNFINYSSEIDYNVSRSAFLISCEYKKYDYIVQKSTFGSQLL